MGNKVMDNANAFPTKAAKALTVAAIAAMFAGCGTGCLYHEFGKILVVPGDSPPSPQRVVAVIGDALRPLGFSGKAADTPTPRAAGYWDYEFSVGGEKFRARPRVMVFIKYEDLSLTLSDFARNSSAPSFDRSITEGISTRLRTELGADINFTHPPSPALCLGPELLHAVQSVACK
jgi:hypothetical protein